MMLRRAAWMAVIATGCGVGAPAPLRIIPDRLSGNRTRLTLSVGPGFHLNPRLNPVLERPGLPPERFPLEPEAESAGLVTRAVLLVRGPVVGVVRASVCSRDASVCRVVELAITR